MDEKVKFVQKQLHGRGLDAGPEDGVMGRKTREALGKVREIPDDWSDERKVIGFIQLLCRDKEINAGKIDGYWGPNTEFAFDSLMILLDSGAHPENWRDDDEPDDEVWPRQTKSRNDIIRYFGEPGQNQTKIVLPYPHKFSWDTDTVINRFSCHEKVHDSLERVLTRVLDHYGNDRITELGLDLWGGCLAERKVRGGSALSLHSWGIAVDYDPSNNKLKWGKDKASFAKPEYNTWWALWEEEGWVSLGRAKNYDWMHVQATKL